MTEGRLLFAPRDLAEMMQCDETFNSYEFYDTSSRGEYGPYLSPFSVAKEPVPIPGMPGKWSRTVEGIWQGLKLIEGQIDESQFDAQRPRKRRHEPYAETTFLYGDEELGLIEARHRIYEPSYRHMFNTTVPESLLGKIEEGIARGSTHVFYDMDENPNMKDPRTSYAHSALVIKLLLERLNPRK